MHQNKNIPELLAPAGNMTALHAAVNAGANAAYLGLDSFNARRSADNFTIQTLKEACQYAHLRGVKIYVTLNTIIFDSEFNMAMQLAHDAADAGADAFIVQDLGLAKRIVQEIPQVRLHVSTQMNIHDSAGLIAVSSLGAARVTLAREMSVPEISKLCQLATKLGVEIETFAHGAICVCYSGQCLMSSMIGGRSANRGTCAQACRLNYELNGGPWTAGKRKGLEEKNRGSFLLSPKDLCALDLLPQLTEAGVSSLKIEGRMKSAEYVHAVVGVYRKALDRLAAYNNGEIEGQFSATKEEKRILSQAFSRGFTAAYMEGRRGNEIMSYNRPNNRGVAVGRVAKVSFDNLPPSKKNKNTKRKQLASNKKTFSGNRPTEAICVIETKEPIVQGDVLEVWTKAGRANFVIDKTAKITAGQVVVKLDLSKREHRFVKKTDRVFRVRSAAGAFVDNPLLPKVKVEGYVKLKMWEPAQISFTSQGVKADAYGDVVEEARTKAITNEEVSEHVCRTGSSAFEIAKLKIDLDAGVGIGFSTLHKLRTLAMNKLEDAILKQYERSTARAKSDEGALEGASNNTGQSEHHSQKNQNVRCKKVTSKPDQLANFSPDICVLVTNPACARAAKRAGADTVYVPALNYKRGTAQYAGCARPQTDSAGYPKNSVIVLPTVLHDNVLPSLEAKKDLGISQIEEAASTPKTILADSLSGVARALNVGAHVEIGPHVPVVNSDTVNFFNELGAQKIWLSPELSLSQIQRICCSPNIDNKNTLGVTFGLCVMGTQELMITEHCMLMSMGDCEQNCTKCNRRKTPHYLTDRLGFEFPVVADVLGRSHIYNSIKLDVCHAVGQIIQSGVRALMIDAALMTPEETAQAVGRLVKSVNAARKNQSVEKPKNTTTGHLFRTIN